MAKKDDVELEVESPIAPPPRTLRVSSASRIVFPPATDITPAITKLELVQYVIAVGEPLLRVLRSRPTTLERWPNGVQPGMHLGRGGDDGGFYQKRMIRHAPDFVEGVEIAFPSGRPLQRSVRPNPRCSPGAPRWGQSRSTRGQSGEQKIRVLLTSRMSYESILILNLEPHSVTL